MSASQDQIPAKKEKEICLQKYASLNYKMIYHFPQLILSSQRHAQKGTRIICQSNENCFFIGNEHLDEHHIDFWQVECTVFFVGEGIQLAKSYQYFLIIANPC